MLIGYEANNALRCSDPIGDFCRELIARIAHSHVRDYRALLFSTHIKGDYRSYYSGDSNVSTYVPAGSACLLPEAWMRYRLNPVLKSEKVQLFHGLNEELPYHIDREVKTVVTCYGLNNHHRASLLDTVMWKPRMRYAFAAADCVVAVSEEVREELVSFGVNPRKITVIGVPGKPYELTGEMVNQYYDLYRSLLNKD